MYLCVKLTIIAIITTTIYGKYSPQEYPLYSKTDIAQALGIPRSTVRSWLKGNGQESVISISDPKRSLNFLQLSEAFVINHMRKTLKISLHKIRKTSEYLKENLGLEYPLIDPRIRVGADIYFENAQKMLLINTARYGQVESHELIGEYIHRLEFNEGEYVPHVLYPWIPGETRKTIKIDPQIRFGKPVITGTGISVEAIVDRSDAGESAQDIADSYGISLVQVEDAIAYANATC